MEFKSQRKRWLEIVLQQCSQICIMYCLQCDLEKFRALALSVIGPGESSSPAPTPVQSRVSLPNYMVL